MHYAVDGHGLIDEFVEHRIRKPADESPPKLTLDTCVEFRRATNPLQTRDNAVEELAPSPGRYSSYHRKPAVTSSAASGAKRTSTATVQFPKPSGHLIPRQGRLWTGGETAAAPLNLCKLPLVDRHVFRAAGDIIPEILNQLEFLGGREAEDRGCVGCHGNCSTAVVIVQRASIGLSRFIS